jgi:hypothetical protein
VARLALDRIQLGRGAIEQFVDRSLEAPPDL